MLTRKSFENEVSADFLIAQVGSIIAREWLTEVNGEIKHFRRFRP